MVCYQSVPQVACGVWDSVVTREVHVEKKVDMKCIQVNLLKNVSRMTRRLYVLIMLHTRFRVNPYSAVAWMSRNSLLETDASDIWSLSDCNGIRIYNHLVCKRTLNHLAKLAIWLNGWVFVYELSGGKFESRCNDKERWHTNWLDW